MTTHTSGAADLPEALRMALDCEALDLDGIAVELRRLHTYATELESQVILDCMTHDSEPLAAGQATAAQSVVPAGWKLVPIEPTQEMLDAAVTTMDDFLLGKDAERQYLEDWAAMLAAAPAQPAAQQGAGLLSYERQHAIMQGERNASLAAFDHDARLSRSEERLYETAFANGWDRRASHGQAPAQPARHFGPLRDADAEYGKRLSVYAVAPQAAQQVPDPGPPSATVEEAARHVGKWLNERPNRPLDLRDVAMLTAHAQQAPASDEFMEAVNEMDSLYEIQQAPAGAQADSVQEDAARLALTALHTCTTGGCVDADGDFVLRFYFDQAAVDAAVKALSGVAARAAQKEGEKS